MSRILVKESYFRDAAAADDPNDQSKRAYACIRCTKREKISCREIEENILCEGKVRAMICVLENVLKIRDLCFTSCLKFTYAKEFPE